MKECIRYLLYLSVLSLSACAVLPNQKINIDDSTSLKVVESSQPDTSIEPQSDPDLPNVELDQETLEQLLIQNFASYNEDWANASANSLLAAKSSGDYRIARNATLLALKGEDYDTARHSAQLWLQFKPSSVDALNILIISQVGAGKTDDALKTIETLGEGISLDELIKKVAGLVVRQKHSASALLVMTDFIANNPESAQVLLSSAYVANIYEEYEHARRWLERAIELRPNWELAAHMKADVLHRRGKLEERSLFVKQYAQKHPEAVQMNLNYAADLARQQNYQEALTLMEAVIKQSPQDSAAVNYAGALAQQLQKNEQAKKYFKKALSLDPKNDQARWSLGRLAFIEEKYITAERYFNEITALSSFVDAQIQVANARYHINGLDRAVSTLSLIEPRTEGEFLNVAIARHNLLLRDYKYEEAFSYINEVLLFLPNNTDLLYSRALVAAELKETAVAEADFRAILDQEPENPDALNALGYTLADQTERYGEAKVLIEKALKYRPNAPHILDSMGWVLYRLNDNDAAVEYLRKAYEASSEAEIAAHLGEVLWVLGEQQQATQIWQQGFNKDAENPILNATLERFNVELLAK